jgi:hypothetical protein
MNLRRDGIDSSDKCGKHMLNRVADKWDPRLWIQPHKFLETVKLGVSNQRNRNRQDSPSIRVFRTLNSPSRNICSDGGRNSSTGKSEP